MIGISTYAFVWRANPERAHPLTIEHQMDVTAGLGCGLFQICDQPRLEAARADDLRRLRRHADGLGLVLEVGTRGVEREHLRHHLRVAELLGAGFVRSMLSSSRATPSVDAAVESLRAVMPEYEDAGVSLGLETYEQFSSEELVDVVERVASPRLGICLDPGNSVGRLEHPMDVARACARYVINHHVKDFRFTRLESGVGFTFAGAPLGAGLLDHDGVCAVLAEAGAGRVNQVIEHWLTRGTDIESTSATEARWVVDSVTFLREREGRLLG
jgi:sugar phosphate isomerase/epimerase